MSVSSIGAYESSMSRANWNVPEVNKTPTTFTLVVGNQNYSLTATDNSAPAWVPVYPGSSPQGAMSSQSNDGKQNTFTFKTRDAAGKVTS